jgi:pimeloyl-ACP methyl ester carboxylesterase
VARRLAVACVGKPQELGMGVISIFTDDELCQINIPTLLLIGDRERVIDPVRVLERARRLMPNIQAELIENAGHLMPVDQPDATNERILKFLTS